jgi:hypothetical protein
VKQCTLFCRRDDPPGGIKVIAELLHASLTIDGPAENWSAIVVEDGAHHIRLFRTPRVAPGDKVSKTLLGLVNWLERIATPNPRATPIAVRRVFETKAMIGLTITPEVSEERGHFDFIWALAESLDALVWNGEALFTTEGELLVNAVGESEI